MRTIFASLLLLLLAGVACARVVVIDTPEHAAPFTQVTGAEVSAVLPATLAPGDVVVLAGTSTHAAEDEARLEAFVRGGGGLLLTHTDAENCQQLWERWHNSPIERALPAVLSPKGVGIENYYGRTRLVEAAKHPITAGLAMSARPLVPGHTPVLLPTHPSFSRHLLWPVLPDGLLKPMISAEWTPLLWGDDAERRCLLAVGRYGAGRAALLGVDYAAPTLAAWTSYPIFAKNLTTWLAQTRPATSISPRVLALTVDVVATTALQRMGFAVLTAPPAEWQGLAAVVIGDRLPDAQAAQVAEYLQGGGKVVALSPQTLQAPALQAASGAIAGTAPQLCQLWQAEVTTGKSFAGRRPPRLAFGNGPRWMAGPPAPNGRHGFNFYTDSTGWLEIPTGGAANYALAVAASHHLRIDGTAAALVDPPAEWKEAAQGQQWLPLAGLTPGRHVLTAEGLPISNSSIRLLALTAPPRALSSAGKVEKWQYRAGEGKTAPALLPALPTEGWGNDPPQAKTTPKPNPTLVPLPAAPAVTLPQSWQFTQVGDLETDRDLVERWYAPEFNDAGWQARPLGALTREVGGKRVPWDQYNGAVWYRARVQLSAEAVASGGFLLFDAGTNYLTVWVNGKELASNPRKASVPLTRCQAGENVIAVRVWAKGYGTLVRWNLTGLQSVRLEQGTLRSRLDRGNVGLAQGWFTQAPQATDDPQTAEMAGRPQLERVCWLWLTLDAQPGQANLQVSVPGPQALKIWLNGTAINTAEGQKVVTIPGDRYKAGRNNVVIRRVNEPGWEHYPGVEIKFVTPEPETALPVWAQAKVALPGPAQAVRVSEATTAGLVFVDGQLAGALANGLLALPAPLAAGEHQVILWLAKSGRAPGVEFLPEAPERLAVTRWRASAGGQSILPEGGLLRRYATREMETLTGTLTLDAARATAPALLHFALPSAVSVEPGLVKELWINGTRVTPTERKWAEEAGNLTHKTTTFDLTGLLKAGENTLVCRPDFSRYKGLDCPVPSDAPWAIPLPEIEFNSPWQSVKLAGTSLARSQPTDHYRKDQYVPDALPGGQPLGRWGDGSPLFLRKPIGRGSLTVATANLNPYLRPRSSWEDWGGMQNDMEGGALAGNGTYVVMRRDDTQLLADLLRDDDAVAPRIAGAVIPPGTRALQVSLRNPGPTFSGLLAVRVLSWEGALLYAGMQPVTLPANVQQPITVDFSAGTRYFGETMKSEYFVRAAVLAADGATVLDYQDSTIDTTPPVTVSLATDDPSERNLPDALAGAPQYRKQWARWQPANEALPAYVYFPGETAHLHAAVKNTTDRPRTVSVQLALTAQLAGKNIPLQTQQLTLQPYEQRWLTITRPLGDELETYVFTASWREAAGASFTTRVPFSVIRPFKPVRDPEQYTLKGGFGLHGPGAGLFNIASFAAPLFDMATIYGATSTEIEWFKLDNLIEAPGNGGGFGTPTITRNLYWGPFDAGAESGRSAFDNSSFLPSGERYWEWMGREQRQSIRARHGDSPTSGSLADWWVQFTMHGVPRNVLMFARWAQMTRGYQPQGRTISALRSELQKQFPNEWERFFISDAAARNTELIGITQAPGSAMWSQMDWAGPMLSMRDGYQWAKVAGRWFNAGEPDNCLRRVYLGERFRAYSTAAARAMAPNFALTTFHGNEPGTNNMAFSWPHAQGGVGIWPAENYSRALHDWLWLQIVDEQGRVQPVTNMPSYRNEGTLSLFGGVMGYSTGTLAEWHLFNRAFTLMNVIGAEKALGAGFVVSQERIAKGTPVPGRYHAAENAGNINTSALDGPERNLWETLRNYGAVLPAFVNPTVVGQAPLPALVYAIPNDATPAELEALRTRVNAGTGLLALYTTGGNQQQETVVSELFGVKSAPNAPAAAPFSVKSSPLAQQVTRLPGTTAGTVPANFTGPNYVHTSGAQQDLFTLPDNRVGLKVIADGKRRAAFSSLYGQTDWGADHDLARALANTVNWAAGNPLLFDAGLTGHGFQAQGRTFILVEELTAREGAREVRVKLPAGTYRAVNLIDNTLVTASYEAAGGYLVLKPVLRPLEAQVIVIQAVKK